MGISGTWTGPAGSQVGAVQPAGEGAWRLKLNMPLLVARGVVGSVEGGAFSSRTPVMKLRVNPGLFNGKVIRSSPEAAEARLNTAREGAFTLADPAFRGTVTVVVVVLALLIGVTSPAPAISAVLTITKSPAARALTSPLRVITPLAPGASGGNPNTSVPLPL